MGVTTLRFLASSLLLVLVSVRADGKGCLCQVGVARAHLVCEN